MVKQRRAKNVPAAKHTDTKTYLHQIVGAETSQRKKTHAKNIGAKTSAPKRLRR